MWRASFSMGELNISSAKIAPEFRSTLLSCNA
jgi:hypothetical protein